MDFKDNQESRLVGENASPAGETPKKGRKISRTSPSGQKKFLPHPLAPLPKPLGMAPLTKPSCPT